MTFLQSSVLFALPLIALPILIHLINQNRHKTINWAATMFLLQAKRMARGMARLKYILLLVARMLAIAGLIFAIARPMAGGWLGMTASDVPEMTIVLLDRSVSMEEQNPQNGESKRSTALRKVIDLVKTTESGTRVVLFDTALQQPLEISSIDELADLPEAGPTSTTADIPAMVQQITDFMETNESGRTDIWVCSDLRRSDWNPTAGRWEAIRKSLSMREGVRLFLLTYPDVAQDNIAVTVTSVHRRESVTGAELVMDIHLTRSGDTSEPVPVNMTIVIDGARSQLELEMTGGQLDRNGHTIPLDKDSKQGWGRIELPRDSNLSDNVYNFVYAEPPVFRTVIVSDDERAAEILRIAAGTAADTALVYQADVLPSAAADAIPWEETACILWQAPLPTDLISRQIQDFVASGRSVMFFPPDSPDASELFGGRWEQWEEPEQGEAFSFLPWRTDSDLLANSQNGAPLPVGQVQCYRACRLKIENATSLWQLQSGWPLLARASTDQGAVWFCSTLPTKAASNLLTNGVTFYVMIQRALARGAAALGAARQMECEVSTLDSSEWVPLDKPSEDTWVSQRSISAGLYRDGDKLIALNRPAQEDASTVIADDTLGEILAGVEFTRIDDQIGGEMELASEVWRTFLLVMIFALILEALLCVPERPEPGRTSESLESAAPAPASQMT